MKTIKYSHIITLLLFMIITMASCSQKEEDLNYPNHKKNLTLSFDLPYQFVPTRSSGEDKALHEEIETLESYIKKLDILIFDSKSGERVLHEISNQPKFKVRIQEGEYDIYFLGNYNNGSLSSVMNREDMNDLLTTPLLYTYANLNETYFPLARVYLKQKIKGSKKEDEIVFKPSTSLTKPLSPISEYGREDRRADTVNLIRAMAKISISFNDEDINRIQRIEYVNAKTEFTFGQAKGKKLLNKEDETTTISFEPSQKEKLSYVVYVPEKIFSTLEKQGWERDKEKGIDEAIGLINYIEITYDGNSKIKLPIIYSHPKLEELGYINAARDRNAIYDVVRNQHYDYRVKLPKAGGYLDVLFEVEPWHLTYSSYEFGTSQYKHQLYLNGKKINNSLANREIELHTNDELKVEFQLTKPEGAVWKAALSNGLDFKLTPTPEVELKRGQIGASMGVAHNGTTHCFKIEPTKAFEGKPQYTELYIVVAGNEIQLLDNRELKPGPGHRILIKQVE